MNPVETHQLTRRYGRADALHGLDLTVPAGSIFALVGPNGAGKTTTIKILMNLIEPTSGDARVLGVDSRRLSPRERARIGYVSENQKLPEWMTVRQLLDFCRPLYPTWDRDLEASLVRQFELPSDRKIAHLSRGMAMKTALLSSLAYRPELLVLDEPFSGLDPLVRDELVRGILETSQQDKWTILISSHDINEVEQLADRVALLDSGRLDFSETVESLQRRFRRVDVTLPTDSNVPSPVPASWMEVERAGNLLRYVESGYPADSAASYRVEAWPGAEIMARPMTLREIFVVQARANRSRSMRASA